MVTVPLSVPLSPEVMVTVPLIGGKIGEYAFLGEGYGYALFQD